MSPSSALNGEIREYERTSTTVLNALLMPVVAGYLDKLQRRMQAEDCLPRLLLVQSNGGVCSAATAAREPVRLLLSGPAGGAAACALLAGILAEANVVGIDMGGTSFDVSVVRDGRVNLIAQGEIDRMPVRLPMVEMRTIGAGGGSIAKVRAGGRLTVGPESAGSRPGPACYGRGGTEPTVTDANLALGRLDGEGFLGGGMRLDTARARAAIEEHVARPLSLAVEPAAEGLLAVTNASLGGAIRLSLFEKGLDPRDFAMIAFGGAAGLHAVAVAEELGIRRVVFPESASTLSAYGILHSNLAHDLVRSKVLAATPDNLAALAAMAESLHKEATARLDADAVPAGGPADRAAADMRYRGQAFELMIPSDRPRAARRASIAPCSTGSWRASTRPIASASPTPIPAPPWRSYRCASPPSGGCPCCAAPSRCRRRSTSLPARARCGCEGAGARSRRGAAARSHRVSRSRGRPSSRRPTPPCSLPTAGAAGATPVATCWPRGPEA